MSTVLSLLEKDATLTAKQIAVMLGRDEEDVKNQIKKYEEEKVILGYRTVVNWEGEEDEPVTAMIELKVTPQLGAGFDKVAQEIQQYEAVSSVYLMSGGFDICVILEGKTMKEVALFVAEKLAPMEEVLSTATHFILKKYKIDGIITDNQKDDPREVITL